MEQRVGRRRVRGGILSVSGKQTGLHGIGGEAGEEFERRTERFGGGVVSRDLAIETVRKKACRRSRREQKVCVDWGR